MKQSWWQRLRSWLGGDEPPSAEDLEQLRASFKTRYNSFRLLLTANQRALETMTDVEQALAGERAIDLGYIRQRYTRVAAAVYHIIGSLTRIDPDKHSALVERFQEIQDRIDSILEIPEPDPNLPLVISLRGLTAEDASRVGSKMAMLADLGTELGTPVPTGFVTTTRAYSRFMTHGGLSAEINRLIQIGGTDGPGQLIETSHRVRDLIAGAEVPPDLAQELIEHYRLLQHETGSEMILVLRSSALGEDAPGYSHAGIYESVFDVTDATLLQSFKRVLASKYSAQAMLYRLHTGLREDTEAMCVGCMPMVEAVAGGVAYSRAPLDPADDSVMIHSSWGLPRAVVAGGDDADVFTVARDTLTIRDSRIGDKPQQYVLSGALRRSVLEETGGRALEPSLAGEQVRELARLVLAIERHRDEAQDVEWALLPDGSFVVLQSRTLELRATPSPREPVDIEKPAGPPLLVGGVTASPGVGSGPLHLVRGEDDIRGFPRGAVLLAHQAVPEWALALDRAAAVVTEHGGVAGHLANVAREFEVPALFGVTGALSTLVPGTTVTVDAERRNIFEGKPDGLGDRPRPRRNRIPGSPVHRTLAQVAEHIVPLRLLDPESPDFRARNCQTLHDITRYCHERAVQAMFRFGTEHRFPGRAAKQLKCDVPMQFWIIDLDDGLRETAREAKYVRLDEVVSIPMLALWRGMTALSWDGPPPVNPRGFMDVVMRSTQTPGLDPSAPSDFALRNYFMIAGNFCSLQSRFGYHYTTVESLVSERAMENYASLQFKAGAAGPERRNRRVRLIADVLVEKQFRTVVDGDLLRARVEGLDRGAMEERLAVIGHLLVHTRQLDMALVDEGAIESHKSKIMKQLEQLRSTGPRA